MTYGDTHTGLNVNKGPRIDGHVLHNAHHECLGASLDKCRESASMGMGTLSVSRQEKDRRDWVKWNVIQRHEKKRFMLAT